MTPEEIKREIEDNRDDMNRICAIYETAHMYIGFYDDVKRQCLAIVHEYLEKHGLSNYQTEAGSIGITQPRASTGIDEKAWEEAVAGDMELLKLQIAYNNARNAFMIDKTQAPRPYIRTTRKSS